MYNDMYLYIHIMIYYIYNMYNDMYLYIHNSAPSATSVEE